MRKRTHHSSRPSSSTSIALCLGLLSITGACRHSEKSGAAIDSTASMNRRTAFEARAALDQAPASAPAPMHDGAPPAVMGDVATPAVAEQAAMTSASPEATTSDRAELRLAGTIASIESGAMLVRVAQVGVEVRKLDQGVTGARALAARFGGFVANTSIQGGREQQRRASLQLRVPANQFDGLLAALGDIGKVESVSATAEEVGEEYVDMGARAANARRMEARLVEMLASRTGKLSDALTVEGELARVREQIERYDARIRFLEKRSALSTVELALHEPMPLIDRPQPGVIVEALATARDRTLSVFAWCIASLGLIIPLGLLGGGGYLVAKRYLKGAHPASV